MTASKLLPLLLLAALNGRATCASVRGLAGTPEGHDADASFIEVDDTMGAMQQQQCWSKKKQDFFGVGQSFPCQDLVNNPKAEIIGKQCECKLVGGAPKWRTQTAGGEETVNAQFFGNIIGHAKMLCQIVQAIDCWQKDPDRPSFPGFGQGQGGNEQLAIEESTVALRDETTGEIKFANFDKVLDTVQKICKVIDGGVGELPGLIGNIIPGDGGGGGGSLLDGLFGSIFVAADEQMTLSDNQIPLYTASQLQQHNMEAVYNGIWLSDNVIC